MYSMDTDPNMYVIPLDAIDLNYMSASLNRGNGKVMPLWAKRNLDQRNDEYFEFKIERSASRDELNMEMGNTLCHICDIDVPTPFVKEHYESFKHKINVKIINTALDRIKRSIDNSTTDEKICTKLHFCPVCVTVVNKEEKVSHEKSLSHKNSVTVEKFLYDFYLIYANENNESKLNDAENFEDKETDLKKSVDEVEPKINESEEIIENNNYLPVYKTNENIKLTGTQESNDVVKCVDKVTKVKIKKIKEGKITKSQSDIKHGKSKSDLVMKKNENPSKVNATQSSDTTKASTKKKKKKQAKLDADISKHEAAISSRDIEDVLPDAENLNSSFERTSDVNSMSDVSEQSKYYEYIKYSHHIQETLFHLNCKVCNITINNIKEKKCHLESVSHYQNYLKFLAENMLMETNSEAVVECVACGEFLNRNNEVEHCITIKHITNHEIKNKLNV